MVVRITVVCVLITAAVDLYTPNLAWGTETPPEVSLTSEIGPFRATYTDIFRIIEQAREIIATANTAADTDHGKESLRLQDNRLSVELPDGFSEEAFAGAPEVSYDIYYEYRNYDAPIANVTIRLGDSSREIIVSGHSREQVTALHGLLREELATYEGIAGGTGFQAIGFIVLLVCSAVIFNVAMVLVRSRALKITCIILALSMPVSLFVLPWSTWFAGTAVFPDSASFVVRHQAGISLASILFTLATFVLGIVYSERRMRPPTDTSSAGIVDVASPRCVSPPKERSEFPTVQKSSRRKRKRDG